MRECASLFYGSVRAVKVLLAPLRSTLTVLPPPGRSRVWIHAENLSWPVTQTIRHAVRDKT